MAVLAKQKKCVADSTNDWRRRKPGGHAVRAGLLQGAPAASPRGYPLIYSYGHRRLRDLSHNKCP
jgi:hypothetical protein